MVGQEAALIATHAEVVDEESACSGRFLRRIEGTAEGFKEGVDFAVELTDFAYYGANKFGLVGRELGQCLCSLRMLHLDLDISQLKGNHHHGSIPACCRHPRTLLR